MLRVKIRKVFENALSKPTAQRKAETPLIGDLQLLQERCVPLGREVNVARLKNPTDSMAQEVTPPLFDAQVVWLVNNQIRIKGVEIVEASERPSQQHIYYQTWEGEII